MVLWFQLSDISPLIPFDILGSNCNRHPWCLILVAKEKETILISIIPVVLTTLVSFLPWWCGSLNVFHFVLFIYCSLLVGQVALNRRNSQYFANVTYLFSLFELINDNWLWRKYSILNFCYKIIINVAVNINLTSAYQLNIYR